MNESQCLRARFRGLSDDSSAFTYRPMGAGRSQCTATAAEGCAYSQELCRYCRLKLPTPLTAPEAAQSCKPHQHALFTWKHDPSLNHFCFFPLMVLSVLWKYRETQRKAWPEELNSTHIKAGDRWSAECSCLILRWNSRNTPVSTNFPGTALGAMQLTLL